MLGGFYMVANHIQVVVWWLLGGCFVVDLWLLSHCKVVARWLFGAMVFCSHFGRGRGLLLGHSESF